MVAACAVLPLVFSHLLQMFEFNFGTYPFLLFLNSLLDPVDELFLQTLQLLFVVVLRLLEQRRESTRLGLLVTDRLLQLTLLVFHLVLVGTFLDIWVIPLLILSGLIVHLLQPVTLGERVRSFPRRPIDIVDLGKSSLRILDCSDDFPILVPGSAEADRHTLSVKPCQNTSKHRVNGTKSCEGDT
jgi:hypothetical protein